MNYCICSERRVATRKLIDENGEFFFCCENDECKRRIEDELDKLKSINWNVCGRDTTQYKYVIPTDECKRIKRTPSRMPLLIPLLITALSVIALLAFIFGIIL